MSWKLKQITNDKEPCRLRNSGGSELGICGCKSPKDCINPPKVTAMGLLLSQFIDHYTASLENKDAKG